MNSKPKKVSLFLPCLADLYYPALGRAAIRVLKKVGLEVDYPEDQTCCGQWAFNVGQPQAAESLAHHYIRVFEPAAAVVSISASCVLTVRNHYPELFAEQPGWKARAEAVGAKTYELMDFLVNVLETDDLGAVFAGKATVHDSCHPLRGLGLKDEPRRLLARVQGLELVEMAEPEVCCGFGGAFMAKNPPLSLAMAEAKVKQALETGADLMVMTEPGCLLNVDSVLKARKSRMKARHIVEVLAQGDGYAR
ncbi:MAG: (Fe-S)-binding protein [Pseudomonadota bacterium]